MNTAPQRVLVVIPTYDERENISTVLPLALEADPRVEVLVVDDASPDGTGDVVEALSRHESRIHLLRRTGKGGLGSAYRAGFGWALDRDYDAVVEMDADLSHPADRLPALIGALSGADIAIGSRWVRGGATRGWPWHRRALSRGGNLYVRAALRLGVFDATAGFRAFRRTALRSLGATDLQSDGYCFQVESTYVARRLGLTVAEVPITFTERVSGTSKMSGRIVLEALVRVTGWAIGIGRPPILRREQRWSTRARVAALFATLALVGAVGAAAASGLDRGADRPASRPRVTAAPSAPDSPSPTRAPERAGSARDADTSEAGIPAPSGAGMSTQPGDIPVMVRIPSIGVRTSLVQLGIGSDGSMQVPTDYAQAGWLTTAPAPGQRGPAVIAGHVDDKTGPAVFYRLRELEPGAAVEVTQRDGDVVSFTIRSVQTFAKDRFPTAAVYGPAPGPVLRLITCGGSFDSSTGHYTDNVVAFAS